MQTRLEPYKLVRSSPDLEEDNGIKKEMHGFGNPKSSRKKTGKDIFRKECACLKLKENRDI